MNQTDMLPEDAILVQIQDVQDISPVLRSAGIMTASEAVEMDRILASEWFLVKISGNGDVWRCNRCGCKHGHLTSFCVPIPWSGLTQGLYMYWKTVGLHGAEQYLPPEEQARHQRLSRHFGPLGKLPDLATSHPMMARSMGVSEGSTAIGAEAVGILEPITIADARKLGALINARAGRTVIHIDPTPLLVRR